MTLKWCMAFGFISQTRLNCNVLVFRLSLKRQNTVHFVKMINYVKMINHVKKINYVKIINNVKLIKYVKMIETENK